MPVEEDYSHYYRHNIPQMHLTNQTDMQQKHPFNNNYPHSNLTGMSQGQPNNMYFERYGSPPVPSGLNPLMNPMLYFQPSLNKGNY